jgi:hypothetical protein
MSEEQKNNSYDNRDSEPYSPFIDQYVEEDVARPLTPLTKQKEANYFSSMQEEPNKERNNNALRTAPPLNLNSILGNNAGNTNEDGKEQSFPAGKPLNVVRKIKSTK